MQYEIITRTAEATFAHKKQFAGGGEFAIVSIRLEPLPSGAGMQFVQGMSGKVLPTELIEGVREGIQEASKKGVLAGQPVTDLRATLINSIYHPIDSNRRTFSLAASGAFWDAMRKAAPRIRNN
jgi:elongation factor G